MLHAGNVLSLGGGSAPPGEDMTLTVDLDCGSGIVAGEIDIDLPEALSFVEGSCVKSGDRLASHTVSAAQNGNRLVIIFYNASLAEIPAGNGTVLTFRLKSGKIPGDYTLTPRVKLSDRSGTALEVTAKEAVATVVAPRLEIATSSVDFGRVPIRETYTRSLTLLNTGNAVLHIERFISSSEVMEVTPSSLEIGAGESANVTLTYSPVTRAKGISERIAVKSDAVGGDGFISVSAIPFSVNELHFEGVSAVSGDEVEIKVRMNNMEPITAADFTVALPKGFSYVAGSAAPASRASGHSVQGTANGDKLRIVMFHGGNAAVEGNDGEFLSFRLLADAPGGYYRFEPRDVKLANRGGENMVSATEGAYVSLAAPRISCSSTLAMGEQPVGEYAEATLKISNNGDAPLQIERVVFLEEGFSVGAELPLSIAPYSTAELPVRRDASREGSFATIMNIYSNDAETPLKAVNVSGRIFEPNEITVSGVPDETYSSYTVTVGMENFTEIVAAQMDLEWIDGMTTSQQDLTLAPRAAGHTCSIAKVGEGRYRVIIFSMNNTPFEGTTGDLLSLIYHGTDFVGTSLKVSNIRLSSKNGVNYTSPDASVLVEQIRPVLPTSITLSEESVTLKATETATLTATVGPSNALDKSLMWTTSDEKVATVSETGQMTAIAPGEAIITATAKANPSVTAICRVTVEPTLATSIALNITEVEAVEGDEIQLVATVLPDDATDRSVLWCSSDESVATVDSEGLVKVISVGNCEITATTTDDSELTAVCRVSVTTAVTEIESEEELFDVYTMDGVFVKKDASKEDLKQLHPGIYLIGGRKVRIR